MKNSIKFEFYNGKFQYFLFLRGPGAKHPDDGEFMRKLSKIGMKISIKFEFYNGRFQYFLFLMGPGAKPPDVGEF